MARPPAIKTFDLTVGPGTSLILGDDLSITVNLTASRSAVWAATGTPLVAFLETLEAPAGQIGTAKLPNPAQDGFTDEDGNPVRDWTYRADVQYKRAGRVVGVASKVFTALEGDIALNLDSTIPVPSSAGVVVQVPDQWGTIVEQAETAAARSESASASSAASAARAADTAAEVGDDLEALEQALHTELLAKLGKVDADKTYARKRRGSRTIVLGDSIDAASAGWFPYLTVLSNQRVTHQRNAGIGGNTTTLQLGRIQSDVVSYAPDICIFGGATNDHSQGHSEATTRANIAAMATALRAANITPVVRTTPPCDVAGTVAPWNTIALRRAVVQRHNSWLVQWAASEGISVLDIYSPVVDPATGGYRTAIAGDGTHPVEQGYKDMASGILAAGLPSVFTGSVLLGLARAEDSNLLANGVFIGDANADGLADGWNLSNPTVKTIVPTAPPALGNVQHVEGAGAAMTTLYADATNPTALNGHTVSLAARIKITSGKVRMRLGNDVGPFSLPVDGVIYSELPLAAAGVTQVRANFFTDIGPAPIFDLSQVAMRDRGLTPAP